MFGVGLGLSGVAGCLLSMTEAISPSMGEPYTVTALIVITLGGFGSMAGALVGGLALGVIEAVGMHLTSPSLKSLLSYGIFIARAAVAAERPVRPQVKRDLAPRRSRLAGVRRSRCRSTAASSPSRWR